MAAPLPIRRSPSPQERPSYVLIVLATAAMGAVGCGASLDPKYPRPDYSRPREVLVPERTVEIEPLSVDERGGPKRFVVDAPVKPKTVVEYHGTIEADESDASATLILTIQRGAPPDRVVAEVAFAQVGPRTPRPWEYRIAVKSPSTAGAYEVELRLGATPRIDPPILALGSLTVE